MANEIGGQLIVNISKDEKLLKGLVVPGFIKTLMKKNSTNLKLIDARMKQFDCSIEANGYNQVKITGFGDWKKFVTTSMGDNTTKLCLKCIHLNTFEAICFDSDGLEMHVTGNPHLRNVPKRCIIVADGQTEFREYVPKEFLYALREERRLKPEKTASIFGPQQHENVQMMWEYDPNMDRWEEKRKGGWFATGFEGSKWTNLCYENNVVDGYSLMFTNIIQDKCFTLDVFNDIGVGLGVAALAHYEDRHNVRQVTYASLVDAEDRPLETDHSCRIKHHKCKADAPNALIMPFQYHALRTHHLTFPVEFVRHHKLNTYRQAVIKFGTMKFDMGLDILPDPRREGDESHVVLDYDWSKFSASTGILVDESIKFRVIMKKCIPGKVVFFEVC